MIYILYRNILLPSLKMNSQPLEKTCNEMVWKSIMNLFEKHGIQCTEDFSCNKV